MAKKLTTEEFIEKAKIKHGDKYMYTNVSYINARTKVKIICSEHGGFEQVPNYHLNGNGCPKCGSLININKRTSTINEFINRANNIHNSKYDYSETIYKNAHTKIKIICPEHGLFTQKPNNHLDGKGCSICTNNCSYLTNEMVINNFKLKHGAKYDYSLVDYVNSSTKISIICPKHGEFMQTPAAHKKGQGCPICNESKGETIIKNLLNELNINLIQQKKFDECKYKRKLPFDFYLPEHNICIEYNGRQHYEPVKYFGGEENFKLIKKRDKIKKEYCEKNNIPLIIIKYNEDIKQKLLNRVTMIT